MKTSRLTAETRMRILASVADTEATGIGVLSKAANNREVSPCGFFTPEMCLSMGGLGGRTARFCRRVPGLQTRPVPPTRFAAGRRSNNLTGVRAP